jgi:hypothetical protein
MPVKASKWIARHWTRLVSPPTAVALMLALPGVVYLSGCSRAAAPPVSATKAAAPKVPPRVPSAAEGLSVSLDTLKTSLAKPKDARALRTAVALATTRLAAQDASMHAEFAKTREILRKVASKEKDKLQADFERTYDAKMGRLRNGLAGIAAEPDDRRAMALAASLGGWLTAQDPKPKSQPLGTELPHRVVDYKAGPPVLGTSIAPAYAPNTPGAEPSPLPKTPTPEDTTQTIEVQFTPEIRSLAASLGNDPVKMYEYVRNTIDFEPYYGSRKGAAETLAEGSGNDMDTASLLIALYRVSGIPARYVQGVVDVPIDKAMNWVGVEKAEAAAKLFSAAGVPSSLITSGGKPKWLRIEHCWVEVYVPYEDYRGVGAAQVGVAGCPWTGAGSRSHGGPQC